MRLLTIISVCVIFVSIISCTKNNSNPSGPGNGTISYFPLAIGNSWTSVQVSIDSNGAIVPNSYDTMLFVITGTDTFGGLTAYKAQGILIQFPIADTINGQMREDNLGNLWTYQDTGYMQGFGMWQEQLSLSNNIAGTSDTIYQITPTGLPNPSSQKDTIFDTFTGISSITVPAGTFSNCRIETLVIHSSLTTIDGTSSMIETVKYYLAPSVGSVYTLDTRNITDFLPGNQQQLKHTEIYETQLSSYTVK